MRNHKLPSVGCQFNSYQGYNNLENCLKLWDEIDFWVSEPSSVEMMETQGKSPYYSKQKLLRQPTLVRYFLLSPTWSDPTFITLQPLHLLPTCSSIKSNAFYAVLFLSFLTIHLRLESNNAKSYQKVIIDKNHPLNSMISPNRNSCSSRSRRQAVCTRMPHHKNFEFAFPQLCFLMS